MTLPTCILFDCMDTLLGVCEHDSYWMPLGVQGVRLGLYTSVDAFDEGFQCGLASRRQDPTLREVSLVDLLLSVDCVVADLSAEESERIAMELSECFAARYLEKSYVLPGVRSMLDAWRGFATLGVVSDFFMAGLPRRLLEHHDLLDRFDFVIDSCEVGWRKPNNQIYRAALKEAGIERSQASQVLFIGDNPERDVAGPRAFGMRALWYGCGIDDRDVPDWAAFTPAGLASDPPPRELRS